MSSLIFSGLSTRLWVVTEVAAARRTRAEQRAHYRTLLVQAMRRLLETTPYAEITIDRILEESGVARATFYANFVDKSALLMEVAQDVHAAGIDVAESWWKLPSGASRADLASALGKIVDLYLRNRTILAALTEASAYESLIRQRLAELQQGSIRKLAEHIEQGQQVGDVRKSLIPKETAGWLIWMMERGLYQMLASASLAELERLVTSLTDVIWHSLYLVEPKDEA
jgi:TetR/AcrR family transcriptional regulator, ethionamide resistance regulator